MEKATLSTADKEAILKMAGIAVMRNKFGNWEARDQTDKHLLMITAFYERTVNLVFQQLCNQP